MSKIALSGNASGTGTFTIASPNSNSNYQLDLPAESGTIVTSVSGLNATNLTSGTIPKARMFAGAVLQVLQTTTTTSTSTTSTTYTDVTNLSVSITPSSATNKILILCDLRTYIQADNATNGGVRIVRDSTAVYTDDRYMVDSVNANVAYGFHGTFVYLDSPATTSATTYKVQIKRTSSAGTSYSFDVNTSSGNTSSITVMEVVA